MEASITDPDGSTELCEVMDEDDFHYRINFTPQDAGIHILSIKHKSIHISGKWYVWPFVCFLLNSVSTKQTIRTSLVSGMCIFDFDRLNILKMDFRSNLKKIHIHLHFIATQYLCNYALMEDVDNWTWSYILISIYWIVKMICNGLGLNDFWYLQAIWKYVNQGCVVSSSKLSTYSLIRRLYHNRCILIP